MTVRRPYILLHNGVEYTLSSDEPLPQGRLSVHLTLQTTKRPARSSGPNYDHTFNSIRAALLYSQVHDTALTQTWRHLYDHRGQWVHGRLLSDLYGTEASRRVRELCALGWPIEKEPRGVGAWYYRMILPAPPRRRLVRVP